MVVLRHDLGGRVTHSAFELDAIYADTVNRCVLSTDWAANHVQWRARAIRIIRTTKIDCGCRKEPATICVAWWQGWQ